MHLDIRKDEGGGTRLRVEVVEERQGDLGKHVCEQRVRHEPERCHG